MKNIVSLILIIIFIIAACACGLTTNHNEPKATNDTYTKTVEIIEVDTQNDTVVCADTNGEAWEFYGTENWSEGDFAILTMNTNGTDTIYDDEIINVIFKNF